MRRQAVRPAAPAGEGRKPPPVLPPRSYHRGRPPSPPRHSLPSSAGAPQPPLRSGYSAFPIGCGACQPRRARRARANGKQAGRWCAAPGPGRTRDGVSGAARRGVGGAETGRDGRSRAERPAGLCRVAPAPRRCPRDRECGFLAGDGCLAEPPGPGLPRPAGVPGVLRGWGGGDVFLGFHQRQVYCWSFADRSC